MSPLQSGKFYYFQWLGNFRELFSKYKTEYGMNMASKLRKKDVSGVGGWYVENFLCSYGEMSEEMFLVITSYFFYDTFYAQSRI